MRPVFIVGTERSGTNLLMLILNGLPDLFIPHPPHLMKEIGPRTHLYGDLQVDANFRRLVRTAADVVRWHFVPWEIAVDEERVFREAARRSLYAIHAAIYDQYLEYSGKTRWGCKSTFNLHYVEQILEVHPKACFLHLVRDGRDVAVSAKDSVFNRFHPHFTALRWAQEQRVARAWANQLPARQWLTVHYEDLVDTPEKTVRGICDFLESPFRAEMLSFAELPEARNLAGLSAAWKNCAAGILRGNHRKYRARLTPEEIFAFERNARSELADWGYPPENEGTFPEPTTGELLRYHFAEKSLFLKTEITAARDDRNFSRRWKKRMLLGGRHAFR